jgi:dATP/dGTP diphosphohydrolase
MTYDPAEQDEVLETFTEMLRAVTQDGGRKRAKGDKVSWKVDPGHEAGLFSHLAKWKAGKLIDEDSGTHPLVHAAWRCLAIAWQETESWRFPGMDRPNPFYRGSQVGTPTDQAEHEPDLFVELHKAYPQFRDLPPV